MFSDIIVFLKSLTFIDYIFFFTVVFLMVLIISLIYFIKINGKVINDTTVKNSDDLQEIATALKDLKPISFTSFEKEEEEKAIISYDELLSNTGQFELNYSNEEKNGDVLIKKVDLNNLINDKKIDAMKIDVHLMSLSREEEFLKTLKELQKILS
ncbi:MAG: hypothetical protein PUD07_04135 [bacterium]|nr:hypothetical protein [bacterium]